MQSHSLVNQVAQLIKYRRGMIGLIVLLVSHASDGDQIGINKSLQFPLNRAAADPREANHFCCEVASFRLAEQKREHALLCGGEQSVSEACALRGGFLT